MPLSETVPPSLDVPRILAEEQLKITDPTKTIRTLCNEQRVQLVCVLQHLQARFSASTDIFETKTVADMTPQQLSAELEQDLLQFA